MTIKQVLVLTFISISTLTIHAQRFILADVNKVLENMEDYKKAQDELDRIAATWKQDIAVEYDKIKSLYNKYQAEQVLLSEEAKKQKEDEIMEREKAARKLQRDKFGEEGELFKKRQELTRPIQDKVYTVIQEYATSRGYDVVFDTSGSAGVIFYNKELDKTEDIIKKVKLK